MRQVLSLSFLPTKVRQARKLVVKRGFSSVSEYFRFLLAQDDAELISVDELVRRSKNAKKLYKMGKLIQADSMRDLVN